MGGYYRKNSEIGKGNPFSMIDDLRSRNKVLQDQITVLSKEILNHKIRNRFLVKCLKESTDTPLLEGENLSLDFERKKP